MLAAMSARADIAIIGGGIVGVATALALTNESKAHVVVLEAEPRLAAHQTGNNSGVIHSALYYRPGSQKAALCRRGRELLLRFCAEHDIAHEVCGKVVVASAPRDVTRLDELMQRGIANGLLGLARLSAAEMREREPHVRATAGLFVPETGVVDYRRVTEAMAAEVYKRGGRVVTGARVLAVARTTDGELALETTAGAERARAIINCAGLQADRVARLCGTEPGVRIVPFRGEYYSLVPEARDLVRALIYPVPDPALPFLGVHFTRRITGEVEAGPNAVLAWRREGYRKGSFSLRDAASILSYGGAWRLGAHYWRTGLGELYRSVSKAAFVRALQTLVPEVAAAALGPGGAGVRAQALDPTGKLLDDFCILESAHMLHVLNAPSPAATASLAIGERLAEMAKQSFALG